MIQAYSINGRLFATGIKRQYWKCSRYIRITLYYMEDKLPGKFVHLKCICMHHQICPEAPIYGSIIKDND